MMMRATPKVLKGIFLSVWGGGKTTLLSVVVALTLATVTPALAANGGNFLLGKANVATAVTLLKGTVAGPALQVYNPSTTSASATAVLFQVATGHPPFKVNSSTKVPNLNADQLDGKDSTEFIQGKGYANNGEVNIPLGHTATVINTSNPNLKVTYACPSVYGNQGEAIISNTGSETLNLFADGRVAFGGVLYNSTDPGGGFGLPTAHPSDHVTYQVQGSTTANIEVFTTHEPNFCHVQAEALVTK